ncbi:hypothetical protein BDZ97DRAFT_1659285 [Flammula alnicola]|nr:hypothetical protein BDZ97DRAFT_1659285 [Flammula alnicola]
MALWPRDERTKSSLPTKRNGVVKEQNRHYPNLEQGLVGAATLSEDDNKHLSWVFVTKPSNTRLKFGRQVNIFPATRALPLETARTNTQQRAEQGANFLRTYVPDVEIPAELIRDQLVQDTIRSRELRSFDPYLGNLLDIFEPQGTRNTSYLVFPTGETNRNLNFTEICYSDASNVVFKPSAAPLHTFPTPIQQIVVSKSQTDSNLAVRTYSCTKLFNMKHVDSSSRPSVTGLASLSRKEMGNETVVDIKHSPAAPGLLAVGDNGTVFNWDISNETKAITLLHEDRDSSSEAGQFWRLSLGTNASDYFLMSSKRVVQLDTRTNFAVDLFSLSMGKHVLTYVEDSQKDNILRLCSTNQIIWMDTRFPGRPLLAYAHERQYDRYLATRYLDQWSDNPVTVLTSRNNSVITVYDVSRSVDDVIQLNTSPYFLSSEFSMYQTHIGQQIAAHDHCLGFVRLAETGEVSYSEVLPSESQCKMDYTVDMTKDMQNLAATTGKLQADIGPMGRQEFSQVDLQQAYDAIFREHFQGTEAFEEETAESVYQMLDYFPSYLQTKELPVEHMLTTYDIAFCAGDEPGNASRADFLTESIVKSKRGYRAFKQGRLSPQLVKAPWHCSIAPVLQRLDKEFQSDPLQLMDYLEKFNLSYDDDHSSKVREYEQDSCQQLILDLALSSDVYSETSILKRGEVDQTLEVMTEALSLGDEPPPIEFAYLKPLEKSSTVPAGGERKPPESPDIPIGVRLLLQGWDAADPEDYIYQDPYNSANMPVPTKPSKSATQNQLRNLVVQSQRPPPVLASNTVTFSQPEPSSRTVAQVQSQGPFLPYPGIPLGSTLVTSQLGSSQDLAISTQVLPGPHGGRPILKKKPAKKRLGGF